MRKKNGYTLIELLIAMAIFTIVVIISTTAFDRIITASRAQTKTAESQIGGIVGLGLMRFDVEHAGYGLPWSFQAPLTYPEAADVALADGIETDSFNDSNIPAAVDATHIPKPVSSGTSTSTGIDYLVVKSVINSISSTGRKWSFVNYSANGIVNLSTIKLWTNASDNFTAGDNIITLNNIDNQKTNSLATRQLATDGTDYYYPYAGLAPADDLYKPVNPTQLYTVYGVDREALRMPYNRADFYVSSSNVPSFCSPGTGVLTKGVVNHGTGADAGQFTQYPLLDCVGDMQVAYELDLSNNGNLTYTKTLDTYSAQQVRDSLKRVRIYILAHEGRKDRGFNYPVPDADKAVVVGDPAFTVSFGRTWTSGQMADRFGADWRKYRWKIYTLMVKPSNMNN